MLAVGVVLYEPVSEDINYLKSYAASVEYLYLYMNSPIPVELQGNILPNNCKICGTGTNHGVAVAVNEMAKLARRDGVSYLLLLDQDSRLEPGFAGRIQKLVVQNDQYPYLCLNVMADGTEMYKLYDGAEYAELTFCILAGSIVEVNKFIEDGGFDENLFVDQVDREFWIRKSLAGISVRCLQKEVLYQRIGDGKRNCFKLYEHNANRHYDLMRAKRYISKKFKNNFSASTRFRMVHLSAARQLASIIFCEKEKIAKIKLLFNAWFIN
jgi:rhamnosyltransferase